MYIRIYAHPNARKESVTRESNTSFTISVKEPAERNMANRRIHTLIARELGVPHSAVRLLTGHRSSVKMYSVEG